VSSSDEDVLRFIAASFPSVWALELLLVLKRERRLWAREELVTTLRASELVVSKALDALVTAGLASTEGEGAAYLPVSRDVEDCVEQVEQLYRSRPNSVRRAIVSTSTRTANAFAEAFKLRRETGD
jgi:DNA-binding GntR family transcriptional regulator